ncbi:MULTISPECIES: N-acetylneuraminate synthase family protein [Micromonospora]|uniref:N-acetylneuraminate synthase family protein n=1 Tax=Micromonospora TaxID=1873 RepID=UPI001C317193|nr:N-acetylneuraminate synthase family protein [Micromonospora yangpuensis]
MIAEIGHNHEGSLHRAEEMFRQAAAAGANAAKLQKRDNRSLFTKAMYDEPYTGRNSFGPTYGRHREALEFGRAEYLHLAGVAAELGIDFIATAFDQPSVDFLVDVDLPAIKIASADVTNTPLLAYAAKADKPLVLSTGGATTDEVRRACDTILPLNPNLALLQCTAVYPAAPADLNLSVITTYRAEYPHTVIGFSGHDLGPELSWIAYALGARVIEKHFTLDHSRPGSDHHFSLDAPQLAALTAGLRRTHEALGEPVKRCGDSEAKAVRKMGKKLVAARDLPAGHVVTEQDVACKSPGDGMKPYQLDEVLGRVLRVDLAEDTGFGPELLAEPAGAVVGANRGAH